MLDLFFLAFALAFLGAGMRRPFIFVLAYIWIDVVAPQKVVGWGIISHIPISLIAFVCAFGGWLFADDKRGARFSMRQALLVMLLAYCFLTTQTADFPGPAAEKWSWVWKALVFATFLPLTLRTRLRIESMALIMVLSVAVIVIGGGIKTLAGGGGYGELTLLVNDNTGLYEGSIISAVAIAVIPLAFWLTRHGTIFLPDWRVKVFALALSFACLLMPVGTQARTGLICAAVLAILALRTAKNRFVLLGLLGVGALLAYPMLPASFKERMGTIENHQGDQSASTRLAVWTWTIKYAEQHPFGGGFEAYRQNNVTYDTIEKDKAGSSVEIDKEKIQEKGRAYHSSYFEMLGEQGYPGLALWLMLHLLGVWQMEIVRRRYRKDPPEGMAWVSPLANALQQSQIVYLVGSVFVGIAFQPFCYMLVGLQCGLWSYVKQTRFVPAKRRSRRAQPPATEPLPSA